MVYTEDAANILNLRIYTTTQALFTKYLSADMIANCALVNGWNHLVIHPSQWTSVAGDDLQGQTINLQIALRGRDVVSAYVDSMYLGELGKPTAVICFDDAMPSQYTYAKPAMLAKGFRGTMAIPSAGVDVANRMTTAQIQEIYADGWDVMNHSDTHPNFTTLTEAERIAEMNTCAAYLAANGLVRGADHFAFPGNSADAAS
ncbi:MAG: polysaccharide deacetylase family protein, partial [Synergistaceae bacterium]